MKFHCDRCKTRYSIADDRVRGKILKIRCKNCSSVITVKEGGQVSGPRPARLATSDGARVAAARGRAGGRRRATSTSGSALQGAFEQALRRPQSIGAVDMTDAPAVLAAEWYVSQDGAQFGPFWYDTNGPRILYQSGGTGAGPWILQSYNTSTLAYVQVDAAGGDADAGERLHQPGFC